MAKLNVIDTLQDLRGYVGVEEEEDEGNCFNFTKEVGCHAEDCKGPTDKTVWRKKVGERFQCKGPAKNGDFEKCPIIRQYYGSLEGLLPPEARINLKDLQES